MLRVASAALRASRSARQPFTAFVQSRGYSSQELSEADFNKKWKSYFDDTTVNPLEVRKGLNDVFAYDLVPANEILEAAFRATRRTNDFATSVRIFEAIKDKAQSEETYKTIVSQLKPVITELNLSTPEELGLA